MATAGIVINDWKLPIFERHLQQSGYAFTKRDCAGGIMVINVQTTNLEALAKVVLAATAEAEQAGTLQ